MRIFLKDLSLRILLYRFPFQDIFLLGRKEAHKRAGHTHKLRAYIFTEGLNPLSDLQKGIISLLMQDFSYLFIDGIAFLKKIIQGRSFRKTFKNFVKDYNSGKTLKDYHRGSSSEKT